MSCLVPDGRAQTPDSADLRQIAVNAARVGGTLALEAFRSEFAVQLKADRSEVTDADLAAERAVVETIRATRPNDAFIGEEGVAQREDAVPQVSASDQVCWVIDPIDGTRNYVRGVPYFGCAVAAMVANQPVAGAVFVPLSGTMYSASLPEGMFIDDEHIDTLPDPTERTRARKLLVGTPSSAAGPAGDWFQRLWNRVVARNFGATAVHLAWVAAGHLDAALVSDSKLWDVAAGAVMLAVTGGCLNDLDGKPVFPLDVAQYRGEPLPCVAASGDDVYERLLEVGRP